MRAFLPTIFALERMGPKRAKSLLISTLMLSFLSLACQGEAQKASPRHEKASSATAIVSPMAQFEGDKTKMAAADWACMFEGEEGRFMAAVNAQKLEVRLPRVRLLQAPYQPPTYVGAFCMRLKSGQPLMAPLYRYREEAGVWFIANKGESYIDALTRLSAKGVKGPPRLIMFAANDLRAALLAR